MSTLVFFLILLAALLHTGWNALIRGGTSKVTTMLVMTSVQAMFGMVLALFYGWPSAEVWPWLIASGVFHAGYQVFLAFAYEQGDLSRVYPIARGAAPMLVLGFSVVFLADVVRPQDVAGILILGLGILAMGQGALASGESRRLVPLALASAFMTAGYSLVDGLGARVAEEAMLFISWLFIMAAAFFIPSILILRGPSVLRTDRRIWALGGCAAILSFAAFTIVVWAMTVAPIALVTALRETSILFAVLIGWLVFGERMDRTKAVAAGLIVLGVVLTRL